jgi:hypothetical protein
MPKRLDGEELADWRAGRNAFYQLAALTVGARRAGLSRSAAYEWHNRYEEEGIEGLRDRPRPGRQPRIDAVTSARFKERIVAPPWSANLTAIKPMFSGSCGAGSMRSK